jgi:hypothetical protein
MILALDGAWRSGHDTTDIILAYKNKLEENFKRKWPDWRVMDPNKAIEHIRD